MEATSRPGGILVTDFDGTVTRRDFFRLVVEILRPQNALAYWEEYRCGKRTHFEALQAIYADIRTDEATLRDVVRQMNPDPEWAPRVAALRAAGWEVVVVSAGCDWYIRQLLAERNLDVEVHANPGHFEPDRGLQMHLPTASRFFLRTHGIDKAAVVREFQQTGRPVAFAGDGNPDFAAAQMVAPELRFARSDLARALTREGMPYRPFERWADVAQALL